MIWRNLIEETKHQSLGSTRHPDIDGVDYHVTAGENTFTLQPSNFEDDRAAGTPVFFEITGNKSGFITTDQAMAIGMAFIKAAQQELRRTES